MSLRRLVGASVFVASFACASPNYDRDMRYGVAAGESGPLIVVEELELGVEPGRYGARNEWIGVGVAQRTVRHLRAKGYRAVARPRGAQEPSGDVTIAGSVVRADGGSETARGWVGMGAGSAVLGVSVRALRSDGTPLGEFAIERRSARALNSVVLMEACANRIGLDIAEWLRKTAL